MASCVEGGLRTHISFIKDVEASGVVSVGDALGRREHVEVQELLAVDRVDQRLAQAQRVELEVHLEERVDDLQKSKLLLLVTWQQHDRGQRFDQHLAQLQHIQPQEHLEERHYPKGEEIG